MYIIRFGFCDIQSNQGLGKGFQPTSTLIIPDTTTPNLIERFSIQCRKYLGKYFGFGFGFTTIWDGLSRLIGK